jgi:hypothetical protein
MFKIDLLNGKELPPRSHPLQIAAVSLVFLAVAVVAAFDAVHAYGLERELPSRRQALARYEHQIAGLAGVAKMLETADRRRTEITAGLAEAKQLAATHTAWSSLLVTLTDQTPKEVVISEILAKREKPKTEQTQGPYRFSLVLGVISPAGAAPVEQLIQALRTALPLQPGPDSVQIVSQRHQEIEGRDAQYYIIECKLKP